MADEIENIAGALTESLANDGAAPAAETTGPSIRETLEATFDKVTTEDIATETPLAAAQRARDEAGRFAKEKAAKTEAAKPTAAADKIAGKPPAASAPAQADVSQPPPSWSADAKAIWKTLSPAVQSAAIKREKEFSDGIVAKSTELKRYEGLGEVMDAVSQRLNLEGTTPAAYFRQLHAADQLLRTQPVEAFKWLARTYGVDLGQFSAAPQARGPELSSDPQIAALQQQIHSISNVMISREQAQAQAVQAARQAQHAEVNTTIDTFRAATDDTGAPRYPHFEQLRQAMGALISVDPTLKIEDAYDRAAWAIPSIREQIMATKTAEDTAKRQTEAEARAKNARIVARTNVATRGAAGASPVAPQDRRALMSEVYDRMQGAA